MRIIFDNVLPLPIPERDVKSSEVWGEEGISFDEDKRYLIAAESGKGKTTFVSIIYGIRKDYKGKVFIGSRDISGISHPEWVDLRRNQIAIVFQGLRLFDDLTAFENVQLKNSLTNARTKKEIETFAQKLGIESQLNKPCKYLSFGQKQRVAIIRSLCQPFGLILLDEPFSHLDTKNAGIAYELIMEESIKNKATLIITSLNDEQESDFDKKVRI